VPRGVRLAARARLDREQHAAGTPASIIVFAGTPGLYPGTEECSEEGHRIVKGVLDQTVYGFEPAREASGDAPQIVCYQQAARSEEQRIERVELAAFLKQQARNYRLHADDHDVYSEETYASIVALRKAVRPAFVLRWQTESS
jgi:hypothetical protein